MSRFVSIHGHFYQPPRENPWLEEVELQDSATPYHDWNERVTAECYAPNTASRIVDAENRILDLVNNYSLISFNIGPTLCSWLERHRPDVLAAIVEADRISKERFGGHGSAIAQVYNHMIMPLATRRDKYTQAYWGIVDFERRFNRYPEGMWLPETAVDLETLDVLAELRIKFTLLSPRQAKRVRPLGGENEWKDAIDGFDPTKPYLCTLPSGRSITLFFYDGNISQDMAFGGLLNDGGEFARRLVSAFSDQNSESQLVSVATDGESYGHHHRHGDMALSYCLHSIRAMEDVRLTNFAEYLSLIPPTHEVQILENSSWSCIHGIERWRDNCGCNSGRQGWHQKWRKPLREAFDMLSGALTPKWERDLGRLCADPWRMRNDYVHVVIDRSHTAVEAFLSRHAVRELSREEKERVLCLCELSRHLMLMYTSCGWFFDDISGIETTQVMRYAARAIQLGEDLFGAGIEKRVLNMLENAPSNVLPSGAVAYRQYAQSAKLDLLRIGAHYAISSLFTREQSRRSLYCYSVNSELEEPKQSGTFRLTVGLVRITSEVTWESGRFSFAVLHLGDQNVAGGVRTYGGSRTFDAMRAEIGGEFDRGHVTEILQLMLKHFGNNNYSLWHLFRDEQRNVLSDIIQGPINELNALLRQSYERSYSTVQFMQSLKHPVPSVLRKIAALVVHDDLLTLLLEQEPSTERIESLANQVGKWGLDIQTDDLTIRASECVNRLVARFTREIQNVDLLERIRKLLDLLEKLHVEINVWEAQNAYFTMARTRLPIEQERVETGIGPAKDWVQAFTAVGILLRIKVP